MATKLLRMSKTLTYVGASEKDLIFRRNITGMTGNVTYDNGVSILNIDQDFNTIIIENQSSQAGAYCLELDLSSTITVTPSSKEDGVSLFNALGTAGAIIQEQSPQNFQRARIYLGGAGDVLVTFMKEKR